MTLQSKLTEIAELDKKLKTEFPSVEKVTYKVYTSREYIKQNYASWTQADNKIYVRMDYFGKYEVIIESTN